MLWISRTENPAVTVVALPWFLLTRRPELIDTHPDCYLLSIVIIHGCPFVFLILVGLFDMLYNIMISQYQYEECAL